MKNFRLLLLLTLLIAPVAFAQNKVTVKGVVKSAETGEPLFGAYILVGRPLKKTLELKARENRVFEHDSTFFTFRLNNRFSESYFYR